MRNPGSEFAFVPESEQKSKYEILANPETRERLKERMLRFTQAVHDRGVESLVFLDRSARPLSWMFQDVWKGEYPEEKRPDIKFVNIGTSSHVHKGVAGLLKSNYWGYHEDMIVHSTSDLVKDSIKDAETSDVWMQAEQIPPEWQKSIIENLQVSEELQTIFKKEFNGKSVLIVDEMGASGKSQLAALGFFSLAFPEAKRMEVMSLFYSRNYHELSETEIDKQFIPWLQELGIAGVLELPDETLLSGAITTENIQKILPPLKLVIQTQQVNVDDHGDEVMTESLRANKERVYLYEHPEEMIRRAQQLRAEMKALATDALADRAKKMKPLA